MLLINEYKYKYICLEIKINYHKIRYNAEIGGEIEKENKKEDAQKMYIKIDHKPCSNYNNISRNNIDNENKIKIIITKILL